jgi:hypothetical protein
MLVHIAGWKILRKAIVIQRRSPAQLQRRPTRLIRFTTRLNPDSKMFVVNGIHC